MQHVQQHKGAGRRSGAQILPHLQRITCARRRWLLNCLLALGASPGLGFWSLAWQGTWVTTLLTAAER